MAAATRVEKLEYKEIPTPKWRIVALIPSSVHSASGTSQEEEEVSFICINHCTDFDFLFLFTFALFKP